MSTVVPQKATLTPFSSRHYRFQWSADLLISCALDMEAPILAWYILVETGSVVMLALFAALQFAGTLFSPLLGVVADRMGSRRLLCLMRGLFTAASIIMIGLAFSGLLNPVAAIVVSGIAGILRPSDSMVRMTLISQTLPGAQLTKAIALSRATQDIARMLGAIFGAALVTVIGMGASYVAITALYCAGTLLTFGAANPAGRKAIASPLRDTWDGLTYVRKSPVLLSAFLIALLVNLTAYPTTFGLLPHVARDIYGVTQIGLGWLIAAFNFGGLLGSVLLGIRGDGIPPGRMIIIATAFWYLAMLAFGFATSFATGILLLCIAGAVQSLSMGPMFVLMLKSSEDGFRGRVMGIRLLAVYGLPVGIMCAGFLVSRTDFVTTNTVYSLVGMVLLAAISFKWRRHLIHADAPANRI